MLEEDQKRIFEESDEESVRDNEELDYEPANNHTASQISSNEWKNNLGSYKELEQDGKEHAGTYLSLNWRPSWSTWLHQTPSI